MTKEVLPLDKQLVENLRIAEANAKAASKALTDAQLAVFNAVRDVLPPKGTAYFDGLKISTGFYERYDQDILQDIRKKWTANLKFPFKEELKAIASDMKYVRENAPSAYAEIEKSLTLTDKKPTFELLDKDE